MRLETGTHNAIITSCDRQGSVDGNPHYSIEFTTYYDDGTRKTQTKKMVFGGRFNHVADSAFKIDTDLAGNTRYIRSKFMKKKVTLNVVEREVDKWIYYNVSRFYFREDE